jgi:hypothetical protein
MLQSLNTNLLNSPAFNGIVTFTPNVRQLKKLEKADLVATTEKFLKSTKDDEFTTSIDLFKNALDDTHSLDINLTSYRGTPDIKVTYANSQQKDNTFYCSVDELSFRVSRFINKIIQKCPVEQIVEGLKKALNTIN